MDIEFQWGVLNYKVDFYFPRFNIIVEYDEEQHNYSRGKDRIRELQISEELKRRILEKGDDYLEEVPAEQIIKFVRINKGEEIDGLRLLLIEITEHTMRPCSDYMVV